MALGTLKLRHRIVLLVAVAAVALLAVTVVAAAEAARAAQYTAVGIDIAVASLALLVMALWSARIIRSITNALREVSMGMERLGRGEYRAIAITSHDELGALAQEANRMAVQLISTRQALEDKATELLRASRYKTEFLANMSHELRTPLNSILILSKVLGENETLTLTDKQVELANLINRSGRELLALINEVLDLAKMEAGKQELIFESVEVAELANYMRTMFEPLATHKQLAFSVEVDDDVAAYIRTDQPRLAQVLKNLLSNAFKFTEHGGVTVRISRAAAPAHAGEQISIAVIDTGIGISADKRSWIFEAFAQAEIGTSRKYGGTGLGLTIAKQLAVRLGGDVVVDSELGVGSVFQVILPIAGPPNHAAPLAPAVDSPSAPVPAPEDPATSRPVTRPPFSATARDPVLAGKLVLIVDDDMRNVYSLSSALRAEHLEVLTASDGQEAIDELEQHPQIDVVLMDVGMPNMNGYEATRRIRTQPRFARLPIIALTGKIVPGERDKFFEAGGTGYVPKPIELAQLLELIRISLGQRGTVT